jgi:hypothetical protein
MNRSIAFLLGLCALCFGQSTNTQEAFLEEVLVLGSRQVDGQTVVPATRIQEELQVSATAAEAVLTTAREYYAGKADVERALKGAIFDRRMQVIAGETASVPTGSELLAESSRRTSALLNEKMAELRSKVGEAAFQDVARLIDARGETGRFFPFRDGEAVVVVVRR